MNPDQWTRIEQVFEAALEAPAEERPALLRRACGGDGDLLREVESLLAADGGYGAAIEAAISTQAADLAVSGEELVGKRFGVWRLTAVIGHGGMGTVYRAVRDDKAFEKEAALKVIRRGMDSATVIASFRRERQILARLDHPYIARLLDGGTTDDGLPFFVMEHVEGKPITEYCAENGLNVPQRLRLFREVCGAVQYAHSNLVVHRDLKPGNIFVTREGNPKLLDFGLAKVVNPEAAENATMTGLRMLTPDYASPEQLRGEPVTTATDIYSLGVVLYELLAGRRPHESTSGSLRDLEEKICRTEARAPSTSAPALRGDLDNIVLMALRKEPARRYATAEQFAEDIRRYQVGLPVLARKDTLIYRTGKFVRRNRWRVAAAALVAASLVTGTVVAMQQARRAEFQAARAERRFHEVRNLAKTMFDVNDKLRVVPGTLEARKLIVQTGLEYLDRLARNSETDAVLQREIAEGYLQIGAVVGGVWSTHAGKGAGYVVPEPNLGSPEQALERCEKARAILERLAARSPADRQILKSLVKVYYSIGSLTADRTGKMAILVKGLELADSMRPPLTDDENDSPVGLLSVALGSEQLLLGEPTAALANLRRTRIISASYFEPLALYATGDIEGALERWLSIRGISENDLMVMAEDKTALRTVRGGLAVYAGNLADACANPLRLNLGDRDQALRYVREAMARARQMVAEGPDHGPPDPAESSLYVVYLRLSALQRDSNPAQAVEACRRAMSEGHPIRSMLRYWNAHAEIAYPLRKLGRRQEALRELEQALEIERAKSETRSFTHNEMGDLLLEMGNHAGALGHYRQALALAKKAIEKTPRMMERRRELADCYERLGHLCTAGPSKDWREARSWYAKSLAIWTEWTKWGVSSPYNVRRGKEAERMLAECDGRLAKK